MTAPTPFPPPAQVPRVQELPGERRLLVSPAWFVLLDDFRRRPYAGGVTARLDRWDRHAWVSTGIPAVVTPSGVVAYPGLGRRREPWNAEPELYRARFAVPGYQVLYVPDDQLGAYSSDEIGREFLAYPYDDEHPPQIAAEPEPVRLLPGTAFGYPPGTRVVSGAVRRPGSGVPVAGAYVSSQGQTEPEGLPWVERTLTDATGAFRLSLRWAGIRQDPRSPAESFTLTAVERPGHTGELSIRLPDDLGRINVIEISE